MTSSRSHSPCVARRRKEESFIGNLLTAASETDGPVIVIITLRADFYAHCANYTQLREALARNQEYIGAMSDEELRRAIEEPARRGRWEFESGLVDLLLHDVGHEPGALAFALPCITGNLAETSRTYDDVERLYLLGRRARRHCRNG